jgi:hypothetical protein
LCQKRALSVPSLLQPNNLNGFQSISGRVPSYHLNYSTLRRKYRNVYYLPHDNVTVVWYQNNQPYELYSELFTAYDVVCLLDNHARVAVVVPRKIGNTSGTNPYGQVVPALMETLQGAKGTVYKCKFAVHMFKDTQPESVALFKEFTRLLNSSTSSGGTRVQVSGEVFEMSRPANLRGIMYVNVRTGTVSCDKQTGISTVYYKDKQDPIRSIPISTATIPSKSTATGNDRRVYDISQFGQVTVVWYQENEPYELYTENFSACKMLCLLDKHAKVAVFVHQQGGTLPPDTADVYRIISGDVRRALVQTKCNFEVYMFKDTPHEFVELFWQFIHWLENKNSALRVSKRVIGVIRDQRNPGIVYVNVLTGVVNCTEQTGIRAIQATNRQNNVAVFSLVLYVDSGDSDVDESENDSENDSAIDSVNAGLRKISL